MDTLMETLQKRTDKKLHTMMYQKITDLTEGVDIQQATSKLIQQFSKRCHDIRVVGEGTWDGRHNIYRFYLRPVPRTQEDRSPYYKFLYGEIYFGSDRSQYQEHVVGYRVQIEDICRFLPIGILDKQINQLNAHIQEAICGDTNLTVRELNEEFQDIYSHMECIGLVDGYPAFIKYLKEHLEVCQTMQCYLARYPKQRHLTLSFYGVMHKVPIAIEKHWYTLININ